MISATDLAHNVITAISTTACRAGRPFSHFLIPMCTMSGKAARARRRGQGLPVVAATFAARRPRCRRAAGPGIAARLAPGSAGDRHAAGQAGRRGAAGISVWYGLWAAGPAPRPLREMRTIAVRLRRLAPFVRRLPAPVLAPVSARLSRPSPRDRGHRAPLREDADSVSRPLADPGNGYRRPWRTMRFSKQSARAPPESVNPVYR